MKVRRRELIALLAGAAAAWPLAARAQQPRVPVVGYLSSGLPEPNGPAVTAFHKGLSEIGFVDGQNVAVEYRWADNQYARLPTLAHELVQHQVGVIVAGAPPAALAAKAATTTIPIVFTTGTDPVKLGLVASLNRPSGNATGISFLSSGLEPKRLQLLRDLVPRAALIAVLLNPNYEGADFQSTEIQQAARTIGQQIRIVKAGSEYDFPAAFSAITEMRAGALLVAADPFFNTWRDQLVALAAQHAVPAIYTIREYAAAGGLMSYGASFADVFRQAGIYTGKILKGAQPADLPVMQPTKFELIINLKAARALGLTVSRDMQLIADEVIE